MATPTRRDQSPTEIIKRKELTQTLAAELLGMPQPRLHNLRIGALDQPESGSDGVGLL